MTPRLTDAQRRILEMLARRRCYTVRQTYGDEFVAGSVAKVLVKRGLARYVSGWQVPGGSGSTVVEITDAGRAALEDPS